MNTVFHRIIAKEIPADIIYENSGYIVIKDINPLMITHWLIIPKETIPDFHTTTNNDHKDIIKGLFDIAWYLCEIYSIDNIQLKLNSGSPHQEVKQIHLHFLSQFSIQDS